MAEESNPMYDPSHHRSRGGLSPGDPRGGPGPQRQQYDPQRRQQRREQQQQQALGYSDIAGVGGDGDEEEGGWAGGEWRGVVGGADGRGGGAGGPGGALGSRQRGNHPSRSGSGNDRAPAEGSNPMFDPQRTRRPPGRGGQGGRGGGLGGRGGRGRGPSSPSSYASALNQGPSFAELEGPEVEKVEVISTGIPKR